MSSRSSTPRVCPVNTAKKKPRTRLPGRAHSVLAALFFTALLACDGNASKPAPSTIEPGPAKANPGAEPSKAQESDAKALAPTPIQPRMAAPACDAAQPALLALRQAAGGTRAAPKDITTLTTLLATLDAELSGDRGHHIAAALRGKTPPKAPGPRILDDRQLEALDSLDALFALWLRAQLRHAVEDTNHADRSLAWARAECAWEFLSTSPTLTEALSHEALRTIIERRFAGGRAAFSPGFHGNDDWQRIVLPSRQAIEKRIFTAAVRSLLRAAERAKKSETSDATHGVAARQARAAFELLRDRMKDKNTPAITAIDAMLAGPAAAIDLQMITDALAITFAKRSRKYCSEVDSHPELIGSAAALSSVTEGQTYSRLILPDMQLRLGAQGFSGEHYLATWDALLEEVDVGQDSGEIHRLSEKLVRWNCTYQELLGIPECTWNRDEKHL